MSAHGTHREAGLLSLYRGGGRKALYLFEKAFQEFHMGYASAMAWILFLVVGVLTLLQFRLSRSMVNYDAV